jgi:phosphatidylglycerophosphate synthase
VGFSVGVWFPVKAAAMFAVVLLAARKFRQSDHPFARLGPANQVTMLRAALVSIAAGFIGEPALPPHAVFVTAAAALVSILDGVDGWLARRSGMESRFGARFDMEIDALLIMILAILAVEFGKAGPWVIVSGLLRYLFVAAGWLWPWLQRALPPSRRRQAICVVQVVGLILTVAPIIRPPLSTFIAAAALAALCGSFFADTLWLWRHAAPARQTA